MSTTISTNSNVNNYIVTGLSNGVSYRFRIAARNDTGIGPYTSYIIAEPIAIESNNCESYPVELVLDLIYINNIVSDILDLGYNICDSTTTQNSNHYIYNKNSMYSWF